MMGRGEQFFIQGSIQRPGRTKEYIMRIYGNRGFNLDGTIKEEYLDKAIKRAKDRGETSLEKALVEGRTLKRFARQKHKIAEAY